MTTEEALEHLGASTQEAVAGVLRMFAADGVEPGPVGATPSGTSPIAGVTLPAVAASVSYIDGVSGGNVFVMTRAGARRLAAAMMGSSTEGVEDDELSELELSAVGEAMNQMMAAAAGATSTVLDETVEIGPPTTRALLTPEEAEQFIEDSPYATVAPLTVLGEPCRLIQLVPTAFVMRMTRALSDLDAAEAGEDVSRVVAAGTVGAMATDASIRLVPVRMSVELGRARMPIGDAVRLWRGAMVELDQAVDEPLLVEINGHPYAHGRLLMTDDGEWAVRIERVLASPAAAESSLKEA